MSSNNLRLELLLKLYFNHFLRDCSYQHCRYNCHNYRLLQDRKIIIFIFSLLRMTLKVFFSYKIIESKCCYKVELNSILKLDNFSIVYI